MFSILEIIIVFHSLRLMCLLENFLAKASDDFFQQHTSTVSIFSYQLKIWSNHVLGPPFSQFFIFN